MIIQVELHTLLQIQTPEGPRCCLELELPAEAVVRDVLARLEIQMELEHLMLVVNRQVVEPDHALKDGDKLDLVPAMSGG